MATTRRGLYFLHIPKTAGTAFTDYLDAQFPHDEIFRHRTWNQLLGATADQTARSSRGLLAGYPLVRGHFAFCAQREMSTSTDVITVLRDPLGRTVSQYEHLRRDTLTNNWAPPGFLDAVTDLADVPRHPGVLAFFANTQTRYLAADLNVRRLWLRLPEDERPEWRFDNSPAFVSPGRQQLDVALRRLQRMTVVGVQDMMQETFLVTAHRLGLQPGVAFPGLMSRPERRRPLREGATSRALRRANADDAQLYRVARGRLVKDYVDMVRRLLRRPNLSAHDALGARRVINDEIHGLLSASNPSA